MATRISALSGAFIWRRIHSLMGLWLVLYLVEHLLVNSQAALWIGEDGRGFVRLVNLIQSIPYLQVVETVLIGIPLVLHAGWGVKRAFSAHTNSHKTDGSAPSLSHYERNHAFTWQRLTAWILLIGVVGHVVQMRFFGKPKEVKIEGISSYLMPVTFDEGLYTLAPRLGVKLYGPRQIASLKGEEPPLLKEAPSRAYSPDEERDFEEVQKIQQREKWIKKLSSYHLREDQVVAVSPTPGTALLLMVRDTFKNPAMAALYSLFVLSAAYHAFNGFWTFLVTWGAILSYRSQRAMIPVSLAGIALLAFLGLAAIWGSFWVNLRH